MDTKRRAQDLRDRLDYVRDIFGPREVSNVRMLAAKLGEYLDDEDGLDRAERNRRLHALEDLFDFLERKLDAELTPMDRVRIVRHPQRACLGDILEHVYDSYAEIGGSGENSVDPAVRIARATLVRRVGGRVVPQMVMVIGHETGRGEEFRNGGSAKPLGNAMALKYMRVAATENLPVHCFVCTPGAYPVEDPPGAAQQIARNLYEMAGLPVPVVAVIGEGGSGGAEALALADRRLMLSHGYYSVISPEGAAAIEGGLGPGKVPDPELVEKCAARLGIPAEDNLRAGFVDRIVQEPPLGARTVHYDFYARLRGELIRATNEAVLAVGGAKLFRSMAMRIKRHGAPEDVLVRWSLTPAARQRLVRRRRQRYLAMARRSCRDRRALAARAFAQAGEGLTAVAAFLRHDVLRRSGKRLSGALEDLGAEALAAAGSLGRPLKRILPGGEGERPVSADARRDLVRLSCPEDGLCLEEGGWAWVGPLAREDRTVTCPNAASRGCMDLWAPDLFGEFAGVCPHCGHHFPVELDWYLHNILGFSGGRRLFPGLEAGNPLGYEGLDLKLREAEAATGRKQAGLAFEAEVQGVRSVVFALARAFRGGSVGAAEGEAFVRAARRAKRLKLPLVAFVHGTAGIRIQEGVHGLIQMPRCTVAAREYIEAGGLYLVLYDTNSYAGPVASFLGCSPYQFAVRSARLGFAGPAVIRQTSGLDVPPDYHGVYKALGRGHLQGVWDRRELARTLRQALLTMGGRNLYYR